MSSLWVYCCMVMLVTAAIIDVILDINLLPPYIAIAIDISNASNVYDVSDVLDL